MISQRRILLTVVVWVVLMGAACERTYERQACRMRNETVLTRTRGVTADVAVIAAGDGFVAAWSVDAATHTVALDRNGAPRGAVERLEVGREAAPPMPETGQAKSFWPAEERASVAAEDLCLASLEPGGAFALAMVERAEGSRPGGAYLTRVDDPSDLTAPVLRLGPAGEYASRISVARRGGHLIVAWHEGMLAGSRVMLSRVSIEPFALEETVPLVGGEGVASPALVPAGEGVLLAWSRMADLRGESASEVLVAPLGIDLVPGKGVTAAISRFLDPAPFLARTPGGAGLVFRDDRDRDETPEFYFVGLDETGSVALEPRRISQSDGWRGPALVYADPYLVSTTIRSFQRNLLVGLNRFDTRGVKLGGEFQVYADKSDFVRVDLAASGGGMVMVYGEDRRGSGRVLSGRVECSVSR